MDKNLFFIDCDPGIDDAAAILLAGADPDAEVLGISRSGINHRLRKISDIAKEVRGEVL